MSPTYESSRQDFENLLGKKEFESQMLFIGTRPEKPSAESDYAPTNQYDIWVQLRHIRNELIWARRDRESMLNQM